MATIASASILFVRMVGLPCAFQQLVRMSQLWVPEKRKPAGHCSYTVLTCPTIERSCNLPERGAGGASLLVRRYVWFRRAIFVLVRRAWGVRQIGLQTVGDAYQI